MFSTLIFAVLSQALSLSASEAVLDERCQDHDAQACLDLGRSLVLDSDDPEERALATQAFEMSCEGGNIDGCAEVGLSLITGRGIDPDIEAGKLSLLDSCERGAPLACTYVALGHHEEIFPDSNWQSALEYYERACSMNEENACFNLALSYSGRLPSPADVDLSRSEVILRASCARDFLPSCDELTFLLEDLDTEAAHNEALQISTELCENGYGPACHTLGYKLANGIGVDTDDSQAIVYFQRSCDLGYAVGCTNLGWMLAQGRPEIGRPGEIKRLYELGCAGDYDEACELLSELDN